MQIPSMSASIARRIVRIVKYVYGKIIMEYEKKYKEALKKAEGIIKYYKERNRDEASIEDLETIFPELKESEDERIRKNIKLALMSMEEELADFYSTHHTSQEEFLAWLEKQGEVAIDKEDTANKVLRSAAIHLITWIDYHSAEGNTCLSRIECEDIENALVNADWGKIYSYMKEKLEKEGEQEPITLTKRGAIEMLGTLINIFEVNYPDGFYKVNPIGTTNMQGIHSSEIIKWLKAFRQRMQMVWHI